MMGDASAITITSEGRARRSRGGWLRNRERVPRRCTRGKHRLASKRIKLKSVLQAQQPLNLPTRHCTRPIGLHSERFQLPLSDIAGALTDLLRKVVRQFDRHLQSVGPPFSFIFRRLDSLVQPMLLSCPARCSTKPYSALHFQLVTPCTSALTSVDQSLGLRLKDRAPFLTPD